MLAGKESTVYHFDDEPRGMTRDYCFVGDIVQANILAIEKGSGQACNIGTCKETHTADLFNAVFDSMKAARPDISDERKNYNRGPARLGDLTKSCLLCGKAKQELGFEVKYSLQDGLAKTVKWRLTK